VSLANGAAGSSDIEGKTTRVGASECGQRTSFNRARVAGSRDGVEGVIANTLNVQRNRAVGFIDWLGFIEIGDNSLCAIVSLKEIEMSSQ
jgi:hypothetical protein